MQLSIVRHSYGATAIIYVNDTMMLLVSSITVQVRNPAVSTGRSIFPHTLRTGRFQNRNIVFGKSSYLAVQSYCDRLWFHEFVAI